MEKLSRTSDVHDPPEAGCPDLNGVQILLVEDSFILGAAMKDLLQACAADVAGPVATMAEADRLISENLPDAALVDINLRGGERADGTSVRTYRLRCSPSLSDHRSNATSRAPALRLAARSLDPNRQPLPPTSWR
jgi:CheY-like chemotaxis protein